jgi:citrate lyase beta subunit
MRHFGHLSRAQTDDLFETPPEPFDRASGLERLSVALGATLYLPADRPALTADIGKQAGAGVTSMVVCLEDSIADEGLADAEQNLIAALTELHAGDPAELPLLFVRVRAVHQVAELVARLGPACALLDGFVLPKFTAAVGLDYLHALDEADRLAGKTFLAMPVLESGAVLYAETRVEELARVHALLQRDRRRMLAVRLGATDLCALYGLRRSPDLSIYDVKVISGLIADVVNVLSRADGTGFTVTGPVWEYFRTQERMFKPQLRSSPFSGRGAEKLREKLIEHDIDGLLHEIELDRANGLQGKTCIHPTHVAPVHALSVVSHEEYSDAVDVLEPEREGGGVLRSAYTNKMNEVKPHRAWAERTLRRAEVFGVAQEHTSFVELLAAGLRTA